MEKIRLLKASEIECRPSHTKDGKANMLLYIDSRAATTLLDETYGMENWNLEYKEVNNTIYGRLSIWDKDNNRYVYREDTGEEANISKDKSIASDILKRLIVRFGVTELYTSPKIQITDDGYGNSGYKVSEINYNCNREIIHLVLVNRFNKEVFRWDINTTQHPIQQAVNTAMEVAESAKTATDNLEKIVNSKSNLNSLKEFCAEKKNDESVDNNQLLKFFNYYSKKDFKGVMNVEKLWEIWQQKN